MRLSAGILGTLSKTARPVCSVYGLLVLSSLAYCPMLFAGLDRWGRGDWDQFSFRYETPRVALLRDRQLPLWNPYVNGGNVLAAHPHCPAFSPWYLPALVLGAPLGLRVQVVIFTALGALGMAALLRRWRVSPAGCFAGGVLLMMSAHFAMHITEGHLEWCLLGLTPWILLCLDGAKDDWRKAVLAALLLASAVLHGSVYVVAIFTPLFALWAVLESVRSGTWRVTAACAAAIGLAFLLSAVVLFPRLEFLRANPRPTGKREQVAPAALARMLFDPRQAELYRATRDNRNPPDAELVRTSRWWSPSAVRRRQARNWYRLDVVLTTTSDWTKAEFQGFPYVLQSGEPDAVGKPSEELDTLPLSTDGLSISSTPPTESQQRAGTGGPPITLKATLYAQLPEQGGLPVVITRGDDGITWLTVRHVGRVVLERRHRAKTFKGDGNRLQLVIPRKAISSGWQAPPWYRLEATLTTDSDWCEVEGFELPYLFHVERPQLERQNTARLITRPLAARSPSPEVTRVSVRAVFTFQCPAGHDLRMVVREGLYGSSTLKLRTPDGEPLEATRVKLAETEEGKVHEYVLAYRTISQRLRPLPPSWRWQLDRLGMRYDWHEYGCYLTWLGLAIAVVGMVVCFRRQWPLLAAGLVALMMALGAVLPVDLWTIWKLLPMYGSLQVPSRFLAAVVFVAAVCGGFGIDAVGRWAEGAGGARLRRAVQWGIAAAVYAELLVLGWNLFSDVFVCPPRPVLKHRQFAQRFDDDEVRCAAMYSAHYPYLLANSGVLRHYENIAIPRGRIRLAGDVGYLGEAYLEASAAGAEIVDWSMARVKVALDVDDDDRLVLNQNYFPGWQAIHRGPDGKVEKLTVRPNYDGLASVAVAAGKGEVEFYYLPQSFVLGAIVSGLTLLGCLGLLAAGRGTWAWRQWVRLGLWIGRRCAPLRQFRVAGYLLAAVALNLPFVLCHPGWPLVVEPLVRSLAVNLVLLLAPGLPLAGAMIARGWPARLHLLWAVAASVAVFAAALVAVQLSPWPVTGSTLWNVTWAVTNLAMLLNVALGGPPACGIRLRGKPAWVGVLLFAVAYPTFFHAAIRIVPHMEDHDYEVQGTGYGLLTRLEPVLLTDRGGVYYFAHPPLLHLVVAGSFIYYDEADHLAMYHAASRRVRLAESGEPIRPAVSGFCRLPDKRLIRDRGLRPPGSTLHRITEVDGANYLIYPPLPQYGDRQSVRELPVRTLERELLYDYYRHRPQRLETRTTNVFLAALTVALLGWWIVRITGYGSLALLLAVAYATNPEVFVRSSYGGYFALSNFAVLHVLLAVERAAFSRSRFAWTTCLLAGGFAAVANHKLVLLPIALILWENLRLGRGWNLRQAAGILLHPVVAGFLVGTIMFWAYGLQVNPQAFVEDHLRTHLVDRIVHYNPLRYVDYPTIGGLWKEFSQHTGHVLLPLGVLALLAVGLRRKDPADLTGEAALPCTVGLWAVWALLLAVVFSLIDWRQTKHLMPLMLALHLAPAYWAALGRARLVLVSVVFAGLLLWNLEQVRMLAADFFSFSITPAW